MENMKKLGQVMVIALTTIMVGGVAATTADAATWHNGTPKALRGNWQRAYKDQGTKIVMHFQVKAKTIHLTRKHATTSTWSQLKYQKVGKQTYKLKGTFKSKDLTDKDARLQIVLKNHKLEFKNAWSSKYDYLGWYHK
jgi:hypothetical protein